MIGRLARLSWAPAWHLAPRRFPHDDAFHRVAEPAEEAALADLASLTSDVARNLVPGLAREPEPGSPGHELVTALAVASGEPSELGDGTFTSLALAASLDDALALAGARYARFLTAAGVPQIDLDLQARRVNLDGEIASLRLPANAEAAHRREAVTAARRAGVPGVRLELEGVEAVLVFTPKLLGEAADGPRMALRWNGQTIEAAYEKRLHERLAG